jgi:hypothetical protein
MYDDVLVFHSGSPIILCCASQVPRSELLRICAFSRPKVELPSDLLAVSNWKDSNEDEGECRMLLQPMTCSDAHSRCLDRGAFVAQL